MAKTTKVSDGRWEYRGGFIEHFPGGGPPRQGNWRWGVCGASGWRHDKADAKTAIDSVLARAKAILDSEERSPVHGKGRA